MCEYDVEQVTGGNALRDLESSYENAGPAENLNYNDGEPVINKYQAGG